MLCESPAPPPWVTQLLLSNVFCKSPAPPPWVPQLLLSNVLCESPAPPLYSLSSCTPTCFVRVQHHLHGSLSSCSPTCFVRVQHHLHGSLSSCSPTCFVRVQHHLHGSLSSCTPTCFVRVQHHLSIHSAPALQRALPALTPSYIIIRLMTNRSVIIDVVIAGWRVRRNRSNKPNYVTNEPVGTEMKGVGLLNFKRQPGKSPFRSHSVQHRFMHLFRRRRFSSQTGSPVAWMYAAACWRFSTEGRRLSLGRLTG